jgi:hypothetical protein
MTKDEAIVRFELMSRRLTGQAWLFLVLVLVLPITGALAVIYAVGNGVTVAQRLSG